MTAACAKRTGAPRLPSWRSPFQGVFVFVNVCAPTHARCMVSLATTSNDSHSESEVKCQSCLHALCILYTFRVPGYRRCLGEGMLFHMLACVCMRSKGLTCCARVTPACSHACSDEALTSPVCHACGCASSFSTRFCSMPYGENLPELAVPVQFGDDWQAADLDCRWCCRIASHKNQVQITQARSRCCC